MRSGRLLDQPPYIHTEITNATQKYIIENNSHSISIGQKSYNPYYTGTAILYSVMPDSNIRQRGNISNGRAVGLGNSGGLWNPYEDERGFYGSYNSQILISGSLLMRLSCGGTSLPVRQTGETLAPAGNLYRLEKVLTIFYFK